MATKKAAATKTKKKSTAKKGVRWATKLPVGVVHEKHPDAHNVSGKYAFFYLLFACTTLIFAGIAVWLFSFSSELMAKYEAVQTRANNQTTEETRYVENGETVEE